MARKLRLLILLFVLATVAVGAWRANSRLTGWEHTVHVALYPIAADDSPATRRFVAGLDSGDFAEIADWVQAQAAAHGRDVLQPVALNLAPALAERPPLPPRQAGMLDAILWSLHFRWWAWRHDAITGPRPHVRLFVLYHDPARTNPLPHSTGLAKGQVALIHAFASPEQRRQNAVVIAHELLHVFGAGDKYDPATLQPRWPDGYAEPAREPRHPQRQAEIMGGRIALDEHRSEIPATLGDTVIGPQTAREIGLLRSTR
jgi:hypothetical protein